MRIRIDTEQVRNVGRRLISEADELRWIEQRLRTAARNLSWESRSRLSIEDDVWAASRRAGVLASDLSDLGGRLARTAERFEAADNAAAEDLGTIPWEIIKPPEGPVPGSPEDLYGPEWAAVMRFIKDGADWLKVYLEILDKLGLLHLAPLLGISMDVFINGFENWEQFGGDISKVAAGIIVDTMIGILIGKVVELVITVGATAIAGPIGTFLGGIGGKVAGVLVSKWLTDWFKTTGAHDWMVDQVDRGIHAIADRAAQAFSEPAQAVPAPLPP